MCTCTINNQTVLFWSKTAVIMGKWWIGIKVVANTYPSRNSASFTNLSDCHWGHYNRFNDAPSDLKTRLLILVREWGSGFWYFCQALYGRAPFCAQDTQFHKYNKLSGSLKHFAIYTSPDSWIKNILRILPGKTINKIVHTHRIRDIVHYGKPLATFLVSKSSIIPLRMQILGVCC